MIILVTGPTASGKTSTCWSLMSHFERLVFLDADFLGFRKPFDWHADTDMGVLYEQLVHNMQFQFDRGERCFVVTLTAHMAVLFPQHSSMFHHFSLPMHPFRFQCDPDEIERRIPSRDRGRVQIEREMRNHRKSAAMLDQAFPDDEVFRRIDTTAIEEDIVAEKMVRIMGEQNKMNADYCRIRAKV